MGISSFKWRFEAARCNRRSGQFGCRYQHLVNHGSQRGVNHGARSKPRYRQLTPYIKRIPTPFRHDRLTTGPISPAWESLRRQMRSGGCPAGSGRALRLDPFCLPARFAANDAAADERVRHVELYRERVVVRRSLRGMRMALNMPVSAFAGVAIRLTAGEGGAARHRFRRARTQRSVAGAAAVRLGRGRRRHGRMAHLGQRAGPALGWSKTTACCASRSRAWAACGSSACGRAAAATTPSSAAVRRCRCAARPASSPTPRRCIAASARLSPEINRYLQRCSFSTPPGCIFISIWSASTWRSV